MSERTGDSASQAAGDGRGGGAPPESGRGSAAPLVVTADDDGRRVDALVAARLGLPRPLVMKLLRTGKVRVNGDRARPDARVQEGDRVEVADARVREGEGRLRVEAKGKALRAAAPKLDIARHVLLEDEDVLVLNKPEGIPSHGGSGHGAGLLEEAAAFLARRDGEAVCAARGEPALANRLDRDTSGVILLGKSGLARRRLAASVREGRLEKRYAALVVGVPGASDGVVTAALRKERFPDGQERMRCLPEGTADALPAETRWRVLRALSEAALLELVPVTGRTHQIRAHMAHAGHAILGDPRYGDRGQAAPLMTIAGLRRLALHAAALAVPHPRTGERLAAEAPLPADLLRAVERLGEG